MISKTSLSHRLRQFLLAFHPPARPVETTRLTPYLTPAQLALFRQLQGSEQWHALLMLDKLTASGADDRHLLAAALLHDIGKIHYPLHTWERVLIVLMKRVSPGRVQRWGQEPPQGLAKPFAVACHHAEWGADLASRAGASPLTIELIRRHEEAVPPEAATHTEKLLRLLKQVDDSS